MCNLKMVFRKSADFGFNRGLGKRRQTITRISLFQEEQCYGPSMIRLVYDYQAAIRKMVGCGNLRVVF